MNYVYIGILIITVFFILFSRNYMKDELKTPELSKDRLRFLYPAAARLCSLFGKSSLKKPNAAVKKDLKQLYVKENIDKEYFIYNVKRVAAVLAVLLATCVIGLLFNLANGNDSSVETLSRSDYGGESAEYQLDYEYAGDEDSITINIDAQEYTSDEILLKFDSALEPVKELLKGENESLSNVNSELDLVSEYDDISISWDIEDTSLIGYDGTVSAELAEDETILVNLFATFSLQDVSQTFTVPVVICAPVISEREALIQKIYDEINASNSVYDSEVVLPQTIDGESISFSDPSSSSAPVIPFLGAGIMLLLFFGYKSFLSDPLKKRNEEMMRDFPEIVSKMSLLYEAGLSIYGAWTRIVNDAEEKSGGSPSYAYKEMRLTLEKIGSGMSEAEAYNQFGKRCGLSPYIRFGNILEQNLSKGTKGMRVLLKQETEEAFAERERAARKKGEEAGTKLLGPMMLMLIIVIVIIAIPAMMSLEF